MTFLPLRPTFWNIPAYGQALIYILGIVAVLLCAYGVMKGIQRIRQDNPAALAGNKGQRIHRLLSETLLHSRIIRTPVGKGHFALFWGFILLFAGTALATVDWDVFHLLLDARILQGSFYLAYKFALDVAGIAVLAGLAIAAWSRWGKNHAELESSPRFALLLGSLAFIVLTGYFVEALRLAVQQPEWSAWSPVGSFLAALLSSFSQEQLAAAHQCAWWIHGISSLVFIAAAPLTFFGHIYKSPWHIFAQKLDPLGALPKIESIEEQESFGISRVSQFNWEDRLAFESCVECGRCTAACPAVKMGTPLDPKQMVLKLQKALRDGKTETEISSLVSQEELWACSTCGACMNACPSRIHLPDLIVRMRTHHALEEGQFPKGVSRTLQNVASVGNPWGLDPGSRLDWAQGLDLPIMEPGVPVDILYWVGCSASYDRRAQKIARAMVSVLKASGLSFGVMAEERCHADFARRLGEEYLFQTAAQENIANLSQYQFGRIVCACPHCFNTLANEYPQFDGGKFPVVSHVALIRELMAEGKLPLAQPDTIPTVYHDPCYLARYNLEVQPPREALGKLCGDFREADFHGNCATCCGAGGGQFWSDGSKTQRINVIRYGELTQTGASRIATACPFCQSMLETAKAQKKDEEVQILDIAEIVAAKLNCPAS